MQQVVGKSVLAARAMGRMLQGGEDADIETAVLGLLRLAHAHRYLRNAQEEQAGLRMLAELPVRWHPLVREALRLRRGTDPCSEYGCPGERHADWLAFQCYMESWLETTELGSGAWPESREGAFH